MEMGIKILCYGFLCLILLFVPIHSSAQIHPLADQYQMNFFQLNPATAGVINLDPLVINSRTSAINWGSGLPNSQSITFHSKLFKEKSYFNQKGYRNRGKNAFGKVGLGAGVFTYTYGQTRQSGIHLDYAYHVFLNTGMLSFGLAPVLIVLSPNLTDLDFDVDPDPVMEQVSQLENMHFLDFNAGIHYYSTSLTAGFSCIQMLNSSLPIPFDRKYGLPGSVSPDNPLNPDLSRTVFGYAGYNVILNRNLRLETLVLLKYNHNAIHRFRTDLSASVHLFDILQVGLTYRILDELAAFFGVRFDQFQIRYQFEFPTHTALPVSFLAHTIQIGYNPGFQVL